MVCRDIIVKEQVSERCQGLLPPPPPIIIFVGPEEVTGHHDIEQFTEHQALKIFYDTAAF